MKSSALVVLSAIFLLRLAPAARAADQADVYFGYSRVGANLYAVYTPPMNGWQLSAHIRPFPLPFLGLEGDVSRYSQTVNGYSQQAALVMFGPRVTLSAKAFSVFAHGLGGIVHQNGTLPFLPQVGYNATSYALGGGADLPIYHPLKLRLTGDYLGNSDAPSARYSPSHYRFGVGLAYHF